jgi:uncharacterized membrane protein
MRIDRATTEKTAAMLEVTLSFIFFWRLSLSLRLNLEADQSRRSVQMYVSLPLRTALA